MIIPISWTRKVEISNIGYLKSQIEKHGGRVIEYRWIFSMLVITINHSRYEWLPANASRSKAGVKHALLCFVTGWWSIAGVLVTPVMILNNLFGGIDVTKVLFPDSPDGGIDPQALRELAQAQKRQQFTFLGYLLLVLAIAVWFCVLPHV